VADASQSRAPTKKKESRADRQSKKRSPAEKKVGRSVIEIILFSRKPNNDDKGKICTHYGTRYRHDTTEARVTKAVPRSGGATVGQCKLHVADSRHLRSSKERKKKRNEEKSRASDAY
jgi:hypothetical protein